MLERFISESLSWVVLVVLVLQMKKGQISVPYETSLGVFFL